MGAARSSCTAPATRSRRGGSRATSGSGSSRRSTACGPGSSWARTLCSCWALRASRLDARLAADLVEETALLPGRAERVQRVRAVERDPGRPPLLLAEVEGAEVVPGLRILRLAFCRQQEIALRARIVLDALERHCKEADRIERERIEIVGVTRRARGTDEVRLRDGRE